MTELGVPGALEPYRVLDLTEGGSTLSARLLADMGADVIKIERPGGSPTRDVPPFIEGRGGPEGSLFWAACNLNKRGITLDITSTEGRKLFNRLLAGTDFLFESFEPGFLEGIGLGHEELRASNPGLIVVSITAFGQTGPYAKYMGPDIVPWSMGGYHWMCGDANRAPVRPSVPQQAYFHAAAMAASASLIALYHRAVTGEGQVVDQSAQACGPWMLTHTYQYYEYEKRILSREGAWRNYGPSATRTVYPCRDGYVVGMIGGGPIGGTSLNKLVEWMEQDGYAPQWLKTIDWPEFDARSAEPELVSRLADAVGAFFETKSRGELLEAAVGMGMHLAPVNTVSDLFENSQLTARGYWERVEHKDLGVDLVYPGAPFIASETPWRVRRRAPVVGEHSEEVYAELGLTADDLASLRSGGIV